MDNNLPLDVDNKRVTIPVIDGMPLNGEVLTLNDLDRFPTNSAFINKEVEADVDASIRSNKGIVFHSIKMSINKWSDPNSWGWKFRFLWHGRGEDGRSILLIVNDIFPTIHVRMPDDMTADKFTAEVKRNISEWTLPANPTVVMMKRLVYFEREKREYIKVQCANFSDYDQILEKFKNNKWIVADTRYAKRRFYLQACRCNNIAPAGFNTFKFQHRGNPYPKNIVSDIDEVFVVSINDVQFFDIGKVENPRPTLIMPHLTNLNFDLETGSRVFGQAINAGRSDTHCNIVGGTLRVNGADVFRFAITTSEHVQSIQGAVVVHCKTEIEMFIVFANIIRKLRPPLISGYNIDDFDWRFTVTKLIMHHAVIQFFSAIDFIVPDYDWIKQKNAGPLQYNEQVARQYMINSTMKISAEDNKCPVYYPHVVSFVNFDIFSQLKRKHVSGKFSRKSLDHFLKFYGLPLKFEMGYPMMHKIYNMQVDVAEGKANPTQEYIELITDETIYCVFDTIAQLDLCDVSNILRSVFVTAIANKTCLHDVIYYAIGGIVIEKLITSAFSKGYIDSNEPRNTEQMIRYEGGLVEHPPIRGMSKPKLTAKQRQQSIAEWHDVTDEEVKIIEDAHFNMIEDPILYIHTNHGDMRPHVIKLTCDMIAEGHETPTEPLDYHSMYPSIMAEGNLSIEKAIKPGEEEKMKAAGVKTRVVDRSFNGIRVYNEFQVDDGDQTTRGLIPAEQHHLLLQRNFKKAEYKKAIVTLAQMDKDADKQGWDMQKAKCDVFHMEQLECKVSSNTYYGKMGDSNSPICMMAIACDTTMGGRERLRSLIKICKDAGCTFRYGDTDSAYVQFDWKKYKDIVAQYYGGRMSIFEYYEQCIARAHELGDELEEHVNKTLDDMGHPFMRVEKERVGFPCMFIRCKRYAMGNHTDAKNNSIEADGSSKRYEVGISGKKGKSESGLYLHLSKQQLDNMFNILNTRSASDLVTELVAESFRKARDHEWDPQMFIQRAQYKPDKQNTRIINFIERLKKEGKEVPRPYEKFEYGYRQRDDIEYDMYGNKNKTGASDYMELYTDMVKNNWSFDFMKYMTGSIIGELGQYMCCDPDFIVHPTNDSDSAKLIAEDATSTNGTKFIEMLCKKANASLDTSITKPVYTRIFSRIKTVVSENIKNTAGFKNSHFNIVMNADKRDGSLAIYLAIIDKDAEKSKLSLVNAMIEYVGDDLNKATKAHAVENSKSSSKMLYIHAMSSANQNYLTRLGELCKIIDSFVKRYHQFVECQNVKIRNTIGLNKSIISAADIKSAAEQINTYEIKTDIDMEPPGVEVFHECEELVSSITVYEARIKAFDMFRMNVRTMIENYGGGGTIMNATQIASNVAEAITMVKLPSFVYDM
jgi:DNA polymerase elongation subunit (family B)